jgi:adenine phosphoribosyltransferase
MSVKIDTRIDHIRSCIRDVPDFPKAGILFRDITPALADSQAFGFVIDLFEAHCRELSPTHIVGIEARGFIIGAPLAERLGVGFVPARKPGKLPSETVSQSYQLEYGEDSVEIHSDALNSDSRVAIVDDLFATGGTALATCQLVERLGAEVTTVVSLVDLAFLPWRERLNGFSTHAFISYDSE